jgi:opacity protein-like surface antigen
VVTFLSYNVAREKRDGSFSTTEADSRDVRRDRVTGSLTLLLTERLSLTTAYSYLHNEIEQDIFYGNIADPDNPFADPDVRYRDTAHNYMAGLHLMPEENLSLNAEVSHTRSNGDFRAGNPVALDPIDIASLSEVRLRETEYSLSGDYRLKSGWGFGLVYRYSDFDNRLENPLNPTTFDGSAHIALVTVSKKW